ncbi:SDR family NAD(P)-dependent oxidoreductase [Streptomyces silvisoli]|uniref:SDR family oxidoreductase n=1 Tax=Streptomyces silvisoli TaxID=3034235 RepID=A0ABT5ZWP0_9ACTN|nr:SDR family oxidoreductase [Streptomyces silvisoli]MDF3294243.1 SDR family oxidoreductase [Streptomyces silvisoli]
MTRLQGRSALVTGATGGIGRAIAEALAREGALVVVTGRDAGRGTEVAGRIGDQGGRAEFVKVDLATDDGVRLLARDALAAAGGHIDILVNNAAYILPAQSMLEATEEQIDQMLGLNIKVPFLLTAALVPGMVERGAGSVINIGPIVGSIGQAAFALYGASKAGLHSLTKSWAAEPGPRGVWVNAVLLGPTATELNTHMRERAEQLTANYPARRPGTAKEVAEAVVFLASDKASYIHGVLLPVDGGALTR